MSFLDTLAPQTNRIRFKSYFWLVYKASKMGETQNEKGLQKDSPSFQLRCRQVKVVFLERFQKNNEEMILSQSADVQPERTGFTGAVASVAFIY